MAGLYRIRVEGSDVPISPQKFALVVTGAYNAIQTCPADLQCPGNCSGHGDCSGGRCMCFPAYSGLDCSLHNVVLECGKQYTISLSPGGWSYYLLGLANLNQTWNLSLLTSVGYSDFYVAFNRTPGPINYDVEGNYTNTSAYFACAAPCARQFAYGSNAATGSWVLGVTAYCCMNINVTALLKCSGSPPCAPGLSMTPNGCSLCNSSLCPVGQYRNRCDVSNGGQCLGCSKKPPNSIYTSAGNPYNQDNCTWSCVQGYVLSGGVCTITATSSSSLHAPVSSTIFTSVLPTTSHSTTYVFVPSSSDTSTPAVSTNPLYLATTGTGSDSLSHVSHQVNDAVSTVYLQSSSAPMSFTSAPSQTTSGPAPQTTGGPAQTTGGPAQTTGGPAQTTSGPAQTTGGPAQTTGGPAQTTGGPAQTTGGPAQTTSGPAQKTTTAQSRLTTVPSSVQANSSAGSTLSPSTSSQPPSESMISSLPPTSSVQIGRVTGRGNASSYSLEVTQQPSTSNEDVKSSAGTSTAYASSPEVQFTVVLPMTVEEFRTSEPKFIAAVASAAGCNQSWVLILAVRASTAARRQASSVAVDTEIVVPPSSQASPGVSGSGPLPTLTLESLDSSLRQQGLPASLGITYGSAGSTKVASESSASSPNATDLALRLQSPGPAQPAGQANLGAAIGGSIGAVVLIAGLLAVFRARRSVICDDKGPHGNEDPAEGSGGPRPAGSGNAAHLSSDLVRLP